MSGTLSENANTQREPTDGEILVGFDFNPSGRPDVDEVKHWQIVE